MPWGQDGLVAPLAMPQSAMVQPTKHRKNEYKNPRPNKIKTAAPVIEYWNVNVDFQSKTSAIPPATKRPGSPIPSHARNRARRRLDSTNECNMSLLSGVCFMTTLYLDSTRKHPKPAIVSG
jgi:hypothetical protein